MFLIDSNVYIDGFNDLIVGQQLLKFHTRHLPELILSMVVVHELLVGASTREQEQLLRRLIRPFEIRRRLHVPTKRTWEIAAEVDTRLRLRKGFASSLSQRSFFNDIMIAATARDLGATIITNNESDFSIISRVLNVKFSKLDPNMRRR